MASPSPQRHRIPFVYRIGLGVIMILLTFGCIGSMVVPSRQDVSDKLRQFDNRSKVRPHSGKTMSRTPGTRSAGSDSSPSLER